MIKHALFASAIGFTFIAPASAETNFQGILQFTDANDSCVEGPRAGDTYNGQFHPGAVPGNSNFSALNKIERFGAQSWRVRGNFANLFQQVSNNGIRWSDYTPDKPSFVEVSKQTPATLTATTPDVTLVGKIKNPWGNIGQENCVANFLFVGVRQLP